MKKQNDEQTKAKKKSDNQESVFELVLMVASTFSSKINAASVSSTNPIAIVQNVMDALEISFEYLRVTIAEIAKLTADARVKRVPTKKSELKFTLKRLLVENSKTPPPISPKVRAIYLRGDSFSFNTVRLKPRTASGEISIIAADKLDGMNFNPASCIGYKTPKADVAIKSKPIHWPVVSGISIFFFKAFKITSRQTVAIPKRREAEVNGPHA